MGIILSSSNIEIYFLLLVGEHRDSEHTRTHARTHTHTILVQLLLPIHNNRFVMQGVFNCLCGDVVSNSIVDSPHKGRMNFSAIKLTPQRLDNWRWCTKDLTLCYGSESLNKCSFP